MTMLNFIKKQFSEFKSGLKEGFVIGYENGKERNIAKK